jgi:hypothetical protein
MKYTIKLNYNVANNNILLTNYTFINKWGISWKNIWLFIMLM